jgi:hypothetical protein
LVLNLSLIAKSIQIESSQLGVTWAALTEDTNVIAALVECGAVWRRTAQLDPSQKPGTVPSLYNLETVNDGLRQITFKKDHEDDFNHFIFNTRPT